MTHNAVGLSFNQGEITLLIGPNGAGKTTTMRLLTGLAQPDGGTAAIAGRDIVRERIAAQQLLSYLPQNPSFHPRFTCGQIVEFYAQLRGVDRARAEVVFKLAGVAGVAHEQTRTLSGGMGQRLGLALLRALSRTHSGRCFLKHRRSPRSSPRSGFSPVSSPVIECRA